jgi:hypothetical protein
MAAERLAELKGVEFSPYAAKPISGAGFTGYFR